MKRLGEGRGVSLSIEKIVNEAIDVTKCQGGTHIMQILGDACCALRSTMIVNFGVRELRTQLPFYNSMSMLKTT